MLRMLRAAVTMFLVTSAMVCQGQIVEGFESFGLQEGEILNNAGSSGLFATDYIALPNDFNEEFQFWSGWSISTATDTETPGFMNQYSAIPGMGANGTSTYAVSFVGGEAVIVFPNKGSQPQAMAVTNSTYAYLSMLQGDAFAKRFGGEDGTDPDYFKMILKGYLNGFQNTDSIEVYLADFRSDNAAEDFILSDWINVDLSSFEEVDSIKITMQSSDVGAFGINTPLYLCIDEIQIDLTTLLTANKAAPSELSIFPNPTQRELFVRGFKSDKERLEIYDQSGRLISDHPVKFLQAQIDLVDLPTGRYFVRSSSGVKGKFVKL